MKAQQLNQADIILLKTLSVNHLAKFVKLIALIRHNIRFHELLFTQFFVPLIASDTTCLINFHKFTLLSYFKFPHVLMNSAISVVIKNFRI